MKLLAPLLLAASAFNLHSDVTESFKQKESADLILRFPTHGPVDTGETGRSNGRRRQMVRDTLYEHAQPFQAPVLDFLKSKGLLKVRGFWIDNTVLIRGASPFLLDELIERFGDTILEIDVDKDEYFIDMPVVEKIEEIPDRNSTKMVEWGIEMINCEIAWETSDGLKNAAIGVIDTGARWTHEALRESYRGLAGAVVEHDYNWHDPRSISGEPNDGNGHGTHTTGTAAGLLGIGVAPGALWTHAKGCASSSCSTADLQSSFEYMLCPTRVDGTDEDCERGVDIVSNSWGGGSGSSTYLPWITAAVDAGQFVIFSQGNSGSQCNTANSPGDYADVIGVGSTDPADILSSFSSRGPGQGTASHPSQKPDVSAPGSSVRSAYPTSDTAYATLSGTSMACPHVAGVAALMVGAGSELSYDDFKKVLTQSGSTDFRAPQQASCGGVSYDAVPNYHYGWSRLDAANAVAQSKKH